MTLFLLLLGYLIHVNGRELPCKFEELKLSNDLLSISCVYSRREGWGSDSTIIKSPVLIKVEQKINLTPWGTFYYDARNIQQEPWGPGNKSPTDEIIYFLFSRLDGSDVIVAKIKLPPKQENIEQIDIEGIYKAMGMYEAGGVIWKQLNDIGDLIDKIGSKYGVQYDNEMKKKLIMKKSDKNKNTFKILNEYKDNLFALKKAQENGEMWKVEINENEHHYFHPLKFRGIYRWRVSIVKHGIAYIDFVPPQYTPMKIDTANQYEFMYFKKKYIFKMGIEKTYGLIITITTDEGEKVDGAVIFWEQQYAGHCSRHTLNNIYNKDKYPKCSKYLEEVNKLPFKSGTLVKKEEDWVSNTESTLIRVDSKVIPEMLHTVYDIIVINTLETSWASAIVQSVMKQYEQKYDTQWIVKYAQENGLQKVTNKQEEFENWYRDLLKNEKIKGIIKVIGSHVYYLRKIHSQNKHKETDNKKKQKINDKKKVEVPTLSYWLNVNSALFNGPKYIDNLLIEDDSLIYIVLERSYDDKVLFPARLWSKLRIEKDLIKKGKLGINNIYDYGEYVGDGNNMIIDHDMNVMLIMDVVVWMLLLLAWICLCCLAGLFGIYLVNKKISNKYNIDNQVHV